MFLVSEICRTVEGSSSLWGWFVSDGFPSLSPAQGTELAALNGISLELWLVVEGERAHNTIFSFSRANSRIFLSPILCTGFICLSPALFPLLICNAAALNNAVSFLEMLTRGWFPNYWLNKQQLEKYLVAGPFESWSVSWGQRTFCALAVHSLWPNIPSCASGTLLLNPWGRAVAANGHHS